MKCWQQRIESETIIIIIITTKGTVHIEIIDLIDSFSFEFGFRFKLPRMLWISFSLMFQCYFNGWIAVCAVYWFIWFPYSNALLFLNAQYEWLICIGTLDLKLVSMYRDTYAYICVSVCSFSEPSIRLRIIRNSD